MGGIYAEAKNVVIWLGPGSDETAKAFQAMSYLGGQVQWVPGKNELVTGKDCDEAWKHWKDESFVVPFEYRTCLAIEEVISSQWLASTRDIKSSSDIPLPDEPSMFFHMDNMLPHRKLFLTETGRVSLGPSQARSGDEVVSIIGSKRLMLLRPEPHNGENFKIVGLCYLNGFMDLEAILGPLPEGHSVRLVGPCDDPWDMRFLRDGDCECKLSLQDPRLESSHEGWKSNRRNDSNGAIIWDGAASRVATTSDPRHTDVVFLRKRGIAVREICIV